MEKKYQITVTEKQFRTIGRACELLGRLQYGEVRYVAEELPLQDSLSDWDIGDQLEAVIKPALANKVELDANGNRVCDIAFDMWCVIHKDDWYQAGSEPRIEVKEVKPNE